jgi:glycosyltransferase involved in cell wall biosynthesis
MKTKVIFFTKYTEKGPSSRYRSYQYRAYFKEHFELKYLPLFDDNYILNLYGNKRKNYYQIVTAYLKRIIQVINLFGTKDVIFIEYELLPYFPPVLEYLLYISRVKVVLDYDDAIFHTYDLHHNFFVRILLGKKISTIARFANYIISGSPYLTEYFKKYNNNVLEIPTSINFEQYKAKCDELKVKNDAYLIGWIGSKSTSKNLVLMKNVFQKIIEFNPNISFHFMGFDNSQKNMLGLANIHFLDWSEKEEHLFLNSIDAGIMPLQDTPSNRGKCGFKLIQYMAMGKPTLSTPLESNIKINRDNKNIFASNENEWLESIKLLFENKEQMKSVGEKNQEIVRKYYSIEANHTTYIEIFLKLSKS